MLFESPDRQDLLLLLPQQHLSKTCLHLYLCCCFWMFHAQTSRPFRCCPACVHQEDCRPYSQVTLPLKMGSQVTVDFHSQVDSPLKTCLQVTVDFHSQVDSPIKTCSRVTVDFHSQVSHPSGGACKCTIDFPSQVTSPLKMCLLVHCDFHSQVSHLSGRACKCTVDFPSQVTSPLKTCLQVHCDCHSYVTSLLSSSHSGQAYHCGTSLFSWCSHLARVSLILPVGATGSVCRTPTVGWVC